MALLSHYCKPQLARLTAWPPPLPDHIAPSVVGTVLTPPSLVLVPVCAWQPPAAWNNPTASLLSTHTLPSSWHWPSARLLKVKEESRERGSGCFCQAAEQRLLLPGTSQEISQTQQPPAEAMSLFSPAWKVGGASVPGLRWTVTEGSSSISRPGP